MIQEKVDIKDLANEMIRLRDLQKKLKGDIHKYKSAVKLSPSSGKIGISTEDREKLLDNFNSRLQQNSWILKKIIFQIKKSGYC